MHACSYMYMPYSFNKEHHSLHYINCWIACSVHSDVALSEAHDLTGLASDGIMQWTLSPKWYKYDNAVKKIKWANLSMPPDANKTLSTSICTVYMHLIVLIIIIIHSSVMYIMTLYIMYYVFVYYVFVCLYTTWASYQWYSTCAQSTILDVHSYLWNSWRPLLWMLLFHSIWTSHIRKHIEGGRHRLINFLNSSRV